MDRPAEGKAVRRDVSRSSHGRWAAPLDRADPVALLEEQNLDRVAQLVPVRRARMAQSPFTFYRGSARIMAADLASVPNTGLTVQLCGDAHLSNFGVYASAERRLVFDLNDFDETFPGPFEWDLKRLAASLTIAGQNRGFDAARCRRLAVETAGSYRETMRQYADKGFLDSWYDHIPVEELLDLAESKGSLSKSQSKRGRKFVSKAKSKGHLRAASKLIEQTADGYRFKSEPPLLVPLRELVDADDAAMVKEMVMASFDEYRETLGDSVGRLLERYRLIDIARKVVGVGSVGTRCSVAFFMGRDRSDVVLLQIKEASASVLAEFLPPGPYENQGRRVVEGQRLLQATSDIFLGWSEQPVSGRFYYYRQLKDWKGSADVDNASRRGLRRYARLCGVALARAHAVSGEPSAIAGYLGAGTSFDDAIGEFGVRYAEQNADDYRAFASAIESGDLDATFDV